MSVSLVQTANSSSPYRGRPETSGCKNSTAWSAPTVQSFLIEEPARWSVRETACDAGRKGGKWSFAALGVNISHLYTVVFALGAALAGISGALVGAIQSVQVGMGEPVLILAFVVIVIGGIGSVKGAFDASILVGLTDILGRILLPGLFANFLDASAAATVGAAVASMSIYILMALVLLFKPTGLYGDS